MTIEISRPIGGFQIGRSAHEIIPVDQADQRIQVIKGRADDRDQLFGMIPPWNPAGASFVPAGSFDSATHPAPSRMFGLY
jgi:hypothetical protein